MARSQAPDAQLVSPACLLLALAPELLLQVVSRLDFNALASFRRSSRTCNTFVEEYSELIYRQLCFSGGLLEERTCAATGLTPCLFTLGSLAEAFDAGELGMAVAAQRSMSDYYEGVKEWKELARRRLRLDRNWLAGVCEESWISLDLRGCDELDEGIWRFKLDVEGGNLVTSGVLGGTQAFGRDGRRRWECLLSHDNYPHVELSEGYFVTFTTDLANQDLFIVWRRHNITDPPSRLSPEEIDSRLNFVISQDSSTSYLPYCILRAPSRCTATKARWPLFLAVSPFRQEAYVWNLNTAQLQSTTDLSSSDDGRVRYVELDDHHIFIAGSALISTWNHGGGLASVFPSEAMSVHGFDIPGGWTALHHDARGGFLVAVTGGGMLAWTCRHRQLVSSGSEALADDSWVLLLMGGAIVQLSVENGRAVFVVDNLDGSSSLWLLNLLPFANLDEFKASPPSPHRIVDPLPCFDAPCRVEQTSDEIFLPSHTSFAPGGANHERLLQCRQEARPVAFSWWSLSGDLIGGDPDAVSVDVDWLASLPQEQEGELVANAICTYSFGSQE